MSKLKEIKKTGTATKVDLPLNCYNTTCVIAAKTQLANNQASQSSARLSHFPQLGLGNMTKILFPDIFFLRQHTTGYNTIFTK